MFLTQGSRVPADARIVEAVNATVNEALLTGEPFDVSKDSAPLPGDTPLSKRANMVYAGTFVTGGNITAVATGDWRQNRTRQNLGRTAHHRRLCRRRSSASWNSWVRCC